MAKLRSLEVATVALEAAWISPPELLADGAGELSRGLEKAAHLSRLQAAQDEFARFERSDFAPLVAGCLVLEEAEDDFRLTLVDGHLRLRGAQGLDLRLSEEGEQLLLEGRRRPAFHLYEYISCRLGPGLSEESRIESAEGLVVRHRDELGASPSA